MYVQVSPAMKEKVWRLLEQYDLPVLAAPIVAEGNIQQLPSQVPNDIMTGHRWFSVVYL